jgi:hypothetical protein
MQPDETHAVPDESPKPPDGLETAGKQLWDSVTATFVLNAGELEILRQAAATADEIALLEAELRASSLVVAGYSGQPRPNPLLNRGVRRGVAGRRRGIPQAGRGHQSEPRDRGRRDMRPTRQLAAHPDPMPDGRRNRSGRSGQARAPRLRNLTHRK